MKTVIVAEKPSVARDIARIVGALRKGKGCLEGADYVVTWALGHLVEFAEPDDYGPPWKGSWSAAQLPMIPATWKLRTVRRTSAQYRIVKELINAPDTARVICATDAGREGENIFRLIYRHARCRKPVRRLWISSLTDHAIRAGFRRLREGSAFDSLAAAARVRAQADWLVGMNLTRAYTVHNRVLCTIGRVQTPTLAMIVARDQQIADFKKTLYYELVARLTEGFAAKYSQQGQTRIAQREKAEQLQRRLSATRTGTVRKVERKTRHNRPPPLYDLNNLQRDANRCCGFTAAQTLKYAQALYETHKAISYPRTESRHISEDMVPELPGILEKLEHPQAPLALERLHEGLRLGKAYVDATKLTDHHAILPTGQRPAGRLPPALVKVYELVVNRFVAVFLPDEVVDETSVELDIGGATFLARGTVVVEPGWKVVAPGREREGGTPSRGTVGAAGGPSAEATARRHEARSARADLSSAGDAARAADHDVATSRSLPPLRAGQVVHVRDLQVVEKETQPPRAYTDATLLSAMRSAGHQLEDETLAAAMKDSGLGTPATRAETIERLIRSGYVERQRRALRSTEKGGALIGLVAEPLRSPELTAKWEQQLKDVEEGRLDPAQYYQRVVDFVRALVPLVPAGPALTPAQVAAARERQPGKGGAGRRRGTAGRPRPADLGACPVCLQGKIMETPKAYGCSRYVEGCGFTIWKVMSQRKLPRKVVQQLIQHRHSQPVEGFVSRSGKPFAARLRLDPNGKVEFDFGHADTPAPAAGTTPPGAAGERGPLTREPGAAARVLQSAAHPAAVAGTSPGAGGRAAKDAKSPAPGTSADRAATTRAPTAGSTDASCGPMCPKCGRGQIIKGHRGYGCSRYRQGCDFVVWWHIAGKKLTENQIRALITKGRTRLIHGFIAESGEKFAARLSLDEHCATVIEPPQ